MSRLSRQVVAVTAIVVSFFAGQLAVGVTEWLWWSGLQRRATEQVLLDFTQEFSSGLARQSGQGHTLDELGSQLEARQ